MLTEPAIDCRSAWRGGSGGSKPSAPNTAMPCTECDPKGCHLLHDCQRSGQKQLPRQIALDLAAGRLRQGAGANQHNLVGSDVVFPGDRLADAGDDFPGDDLLPVGALDFLDHDQALLVALVARADSGAAVLS